MMRASGFGLKHLSAICGSVLHMVCFSFVDDTDLINTLDFDNNDIEELLTDTQRALDAWQQGLLTTGGTLAPKKSYWYLIDFKCSPSGIWKYKSIQETPGILTLTTPDEGQVILQRHDVNTSQQALGVKNRHDGKETDNILWFRDKTTLWADKVRSGYLNQYDAWRALTSTIMKSTEYPLAATSLTQIQCNTIMAPAMKAGLQANKLQSKFPRSLAYGPNSAQGCNIPSLFIIQLIEHLQTLQRHCSEPTLTGQLQCHVIESHTIELRSLTPIWQLDPKKWKHHCTKSWIKNTWIDTHNYNMQILDNTPPLTCHEDDQSLMDIIVDSNQFRSLYQSRLIKWCRTYLNITFLSDLYTPCGTKVDANIFLCIPRKDIKTDLRWQHNSLPSSAAKNMWKLVIQTLILHEPHSNSLRSRIPLPQCMSSKNWLSRYDSYNDRLYYQHQPGIWTFYSKIPTRSRRHKYRRIDIGMLPKYSSPATASTVSTNRLTLHGTTDTRIQLHT